jgi:hypothetical protein
VALVEPVGSETLQLAEDLAGGVFNVSPILAISSRLRSRVMARRRESASARSNPATDWAMRSTGLVEGVTHLKLSIEGEGGRTGSHAFIYDEYNPTIQDGVRIKYDGYITKRGGRLDVGNGLTLPWTIFSNDPNAYGVTSFTLSPGTYYDGDPFIDGHDEYADGMPAPWQRVDWDSPPGPYCSWTL